MSEETLIFIHIPKTAGSTLREIIRGQYKEESLFQRGAYHIDPEFSELFTQEIKEKAEYRAILIQHAPFGAHRHLPQKFSYIAMLREPWSRHVSDYFHAIADPLHSFYERGQQGATLDDFTIYRIEEQKLTNSMTRLISGIQPFSPFQKLPPSALDTANDNMANHFAVTGITELFDESLLLMKHRYGWKRVFYRRRNVRMRKQIKIKIDPEIKQLFVNENELDYKLYKYVCHSLDNHIKGKGESFQDEVAKFQKRNRWYQSVRELPSQIRSNVISRIDGA